MEFFVNLKGKVALVVGASREAGRVIACMLGEAGLTVCCIGWGLRGQLSDKQRPENIEDTAEEVISPTERDVYIQLDHTISEQVKALFDRISVKHPGRLVREYGYYHLDGTHPTWCF